VPSLLQATAALQRCWCGLKMTTLTRPLRCSRYSVAALTASAAAAAVDTARLVAQHQQQQQQSLHQHRRLQEQQQMLGVPLMKILT
jgi:alkylation response protein AidB-like acyl-CoA dehydrogenase